MRCPDCQIRNSVAARKCTACGAILKRKAATKGQKVTVIVVILSLAAACYLFFALPKMFDPQEQLVTASKQLAAGPSSPEDAKKIKSNFDEAMKSVLQRIGDVNSAVLSQKLKTCLPTSAFEALVVDLPRGLKLVEVDTVLQASDFLIMKGTSDIKVFPLSGFEVFDDARAVSDQAGSVIVLLGHSGGQLPHKPLIKTYALLPDGIVDDTNTMVPMLPGEGSAKFGKNSSNIELELTLASLASSENVVLSTPFTPDNLIKVKLNWKEAKYILDLDSPQDSRVYMLLLAYSLRHPEQAPNFASILGQEAIKFVKEHGNISSESLKLTKIADRKTVVQYEMTSKDKKFEFEIHKELPGFSLVNSKTTQLNNNSSLQRVDNASTSPKFDEEKISDQNVDVPNNESSKQIVKEPNTSSTHSVLPQALMEPILSNKNNEKVKQEESLKNKTNDSTVGANSPTEINMSSGARIATYLSAKSVHLRSGAGLNKNPIAEIPRGSYIKILGQENGWYKVLHEGKTGYVFAGLVETKSSSSVKKLNSYNTAIVKKSWTVRDNKHRSLGRTHIGDELVLLSGLTNHKYKIQLPDGRVGWVDKDALEIKVETPELVP